MLIMPSLVLGLALFQLFLYCLVDLLDLFNEPSCLVHIILSTNHGIVTKDKIQRRPRYETKEGLKRRSLRRGVLGSIKSMLHITQVFILKLRVFSTISS